MALDRRVLCGLMLAGTLLSAADDPGTARAPSGLMIELLRHPHETRIDRAEPRFSWLVNGGRPGTGQSAWRVLVHTADEERTVWDSGRVADSRSVAVQYGGSPLAPQSAYRWQVMTWDAAGRPSPWSQPQTFRTADRVTASYELASDDGSNVDFTNRPRVVRHLQEPIEVIAIGTNAWFFDFGRAAFGNLVIDWPDPPEGQMTVSLGEKLAAPATLDPSPPGSVRYQRHRVTLDAQQRWHQPRLTWTPPGWMKDGYFRPPPEMGQVVPFRYAVIEDPVAGFQPDMVRRSWFAVPFDEQAAGFRSSRPGLDQIWELCRYTIQATSFLGVYVDGERERKPYEGDAYINQLAHYNVDRSYAVARHTHEYLLQRPTWPLEWQMHSVMIAWEDYLHTGDRRSLLACYDRLAVKTLVDLAREDGLIDASRETAELLSALNLTESLRIVIDWPPGERDGHRITAVDAVANAFHYRALVLMREIALALDRPADARRWHLQAQRVWERYQQVFFDSESGRYRDGEGVQHSSLHANLFPLAFDLVPEAEQARILDWVQSRGMAGSVYAAHHLLEVLFRYGRPQAAIELIDSREPRSWHNMIQQGATMTMEAWDQRYKPNQDWNHAWATGPAAAVGRWLVGVRPLEPGYQRMVIAPQPGDLDFFDARVPTIRGPVEMRWQRSNGSAELQLTLPANTTAELLLPIGSLDQVSLGGQPWSESPDARRLERLGQPDVLELEGGTYSFRFPVEPTR